MTQRDTKCYSILVKLDSNERRGFTIYENAIKIEIGALLTIL